MLFKVKILLFVELGCIAVEGWVLVPVGVGVGTPDVPLIGTEEGNLGNDIWPNYINLKIVVKYGNKASSVSYSKSMFIMFRRV